MTNIEKEFLKLGYTKTQDDDYYIVYKQLNKKNTDVVYEISFSKEYKNVEIIPTIKNESHYFVRLDRTLYDIINEQFKILEREKWYDSEASWWFIRKSEDV